MKNSEKAKKRLDHGGFTLFGAAAICVFTLISVATASADNSSHRPIASTESGLVIGSTTDGGNEFLGIPYAAPPVGELRWRPPKRYGFFPGFVLQEIPYLFKSGNIFGLPELLSPKQRRLSRTMVSYWTQFAKTGDPNSSGEPLWSPYSASTDQFQSLIQPVPVVESNFDSSHRCSTFWDTF